MKRRRRHTGRTVFLLLVLVLITATLLRQYRMPQEKTIAKSEQPQALGLNHFISNKFSEGSETRRMETDIERFMAQWEIVGASVAIMKEGKLVYSKGFGYADRENKVPMEASHILRIASLSKLITAVAVMKLHEEGKLGLNDRVFGEGGILNDPAYLEIRDKRVKEITVEHLLRHRAGYSIRAGDPMFNAQRVTGSLVFDTPIDQEDIIRYAAQSRLRHNPGSSNDYSNLGYVVLSKVVEKVSGLPYERYVREKILAPIGCFDMRIGKSTLEGRFRNEARYYEPGDATPVTAYDGSGRQVPRSYGGCDLTLMSGAGGWVASPTELLRFVSSIDPEDPEYNLLKPATIHDMTVFNDDVYPIGWMRTSKTDDWIRTGTLAGTSAILKRQNDGYTWVFITNTSSWSGSKFPNKIAGMMRQAMQKVRTWPQHDLFRMAEMPGQDAGQGSNGQSAGQRNGGSKVSARNQAQ